MTCKESGMDETLAPLKWSGRPTGVFAVRTLTKHQRQVLTVLRARAQVYVRAGASTISTGAERGSTISRQTATSLERRQFIKVGPSGLCTVTDHGLHALDVLA